MQTVAGLGAAGEQEDVGRFLHQGRLHVRIRAVNIACRSGCWFRAVRGEGGEAGVAEALVHFCLAACERLESPPQRFSCGVTGRLALRFFVRDRFLDLLDNLGSCRVLALQPVAPPLHQKRDRVSIRKILASHVDRQEVGPVDSARQRHIGQPDVFLDTLVTRLFALLSPKVNHAQIRLRVCLMVRDQHLFLSRGFRFPSPQRRHEDDRELQALALEDGHDLDGVVVAGGAHIERFILFLGRAVGLSRKPAVQGGRGELACGRSLVREFGQLLHGREPFPGVSARAAGEMREQPDAIGQFAERLDERMAAPAFARRLEESDPALQGVGYAALMIARRTRCVGRIAAVEPPDVGDRAWQQAGAERAADGAHVARFKQCRHHQGDSLRLP